MPYDDPMFIAAKWGRILGADPDCPDVADDAAGRDEIETWALEQLEQGPEEANEIRAQIVADDEVHDAFLETLFDPF